MEDIQDLDGQKVIIKRSEILKKFKSKEDSFNFMKELSIYIFNFLDLNLPKEVVFDSNYFLRVLSGSKKVRNYI